MNKQEIEKAIKYWKEFKEEISEFKESYPDAGFDEQEECVDMAISALEHQLTNGGVRMKLIEKDLIRVKDLKEALSDVDDDVYVFIENVDNPYGNVRELGKVELNIRSNFGLTYPCVMLKSVIYE